MNNSDSASTVPTQDERIMAALAHVSIVIPYAGFAVPAVVWITQKDKSRYVAFQSLQALACQLTLFVLSLAGGACYAASIFGAVLTMPGSGSDSSPGMFLLFPLALIGLMVIGGFIIIVYAVIGAVMTLMGNDFRYIILADLLERYVKPPQQGR